LFERVRDIPYGSINSRDPNDVLEKNMGTCSGKHELLKQLLHETGVETKDFIASHNFRNLDVDYPKEIEELLQGDGIVDYHNFIKIKVDDEWLTVDATWDKPLAKKGFVVNENWDAKTNMKLCVSAKEVFEVEDPLEFKKQKLGELDEQTRKKRKKFLKKLSAWVSEYRDG